MNKYYTHSEFYDIIPAEEKQATRSVICFSAGINEQRSDEIGQEARQRAFASPRMQKKNKRREASFVFLRVLTSKGPMKSDRKRVSARLRVRGKF